MSIDQAAMFLASSILIILGCLVILIGILISNNLIAKYWKSWGWTFMSLPHMEPHRFLTPEEIKKNKLNDTKT